jgi:hypothetical protein
MAGPQVGEVSILDSLGKTVWSEMASNATMAIAPDGSFVALSAVSESRDTPEVWLRDKSGKILANRAFDGIVKGVSSDSRCVVLQTETDLVGVNRELKDVWRINNVKSPQFEGNVILENRGSSLRASRMPACK